MELLPGETNIFEITNSNVWQENQIGQLNTDIWSTIRLQPCYLCTYSVYFSFLSFLVDYIFPSKYLFQNYPRTVVSMVIWGQSGALILNMNVLDWIIVLSIFKTIG